MKNFAFFAFITLFAVILSGCAQRNSVLNLAPYQSTSNQAGYQKNIRINSVEDARANKSIVATITGGNGNVKEYVTLQNSIEGWLELIAMATTKIEPVKRSFHNEDSPIRINVEFRI